MNISVFSSKTFFVPLKVMLSSFLEHNNFEKHNIFIVNTELDDNLITELNDFLMKKYNQEVISLKIKDEVGELFKGKTRFRAAAYYKLYMFRYLPIEIDRILCLDADMVINRSLKDFYYQDMGEDILAACKEKDEFYDPVHMKAIGMGEDDIYFNVGVLLIDLKKYLDEYEVVEYAEWYNKNVEAAKYVAQDILNVFYKNKIKRCETFIYNNQFDFIERVSKEEYQNIKENVAVMHFVGPIKPDSFRYRAAYRKYYYDALKKAGMYGVYYKIIVQRMFFRTLANIKNVLVSIKNIIK